MQGPSHAWPSSAAAVPVDLLPSGGGAPVQAASMGREELAAAGAAAFQRLLGAAAHLQQQGALPRAYTAWCGIMHSLLSKQCSQQRRVAQPAAASAWHVLLSRAAPAAGGRLQMEAAALRLLVALASRDTVAEPAAVQQLLAAGRDARPAPRPLLWPPLQARQGGHRWTDPLAQALLVPPVPAAGAGVPPALLARLPLRHQVLLLESVLSGCSPRTAAAAVAVAQQAYDRAAAAAAQDGAATQLWRCPVLSWALPVAATALVSSVPSPTPRLWHQARSWALCLPSGMGPWPSWRRHPSSSRAHAAALPRPLLSALRRPAAVPLSPCPLPARRSSPWRQPCLPAQQWSWRRPRRRRTPRPCACGCSGRSWRRRGAAGATSWPRRAKWRWRRLAMGCACLPPGSSSSSSSSRRRHGSRGATRRRLYCPTAARCSHWCPAAPPLLLPPAAASLPPAAALVPHANSCLAACLMQLLPRSACTSCAGGSLLAGDAFATWAAVCLRAVELWMAGCWSGPAVALLPVCPVHCRTPQHLPCHWCPPRPRSVACTPKLPTARPGK